MEERETERLKEGQLEREVIEEQLARLAEDEHESAQHVRRADKARYLLEKLEERAESEHE